MTDLRKIAAEHDTDGSYESDSERLFGLLVDVAKEYITAWESEEPGTRQHRPANIDAALAGLAENLDLWLDDEPAEPCEYPRNPEHDHAVCLDAATPGSDTRWQDVR